MFCLDWPTTTTLLKVATFLVALVERIYSNFSLKIGCDGNVPLSLVYGSVMDEFTDS